MLLVKTALLWKDLPLADSIPSEKEIFTDELLIGSDYYLKLITGEKIDLEPGLSECPRFERQSAKGMLTSFCAERTPTIFSFAGPGMIKQARTTLPKITRKKADALPN